MELCKQGGNSTKKAVPIKGTALSHESLFFILYWTFFHVQFTLQFLFGENPACIGTHDTHIIINLNHSNKRIVAFGAITQINEPNFGKIVKIIDFPAVNRGKG